MSVNARDALRVLVASLEEHLEAVASRRSPNDAAVDDAYESVAEAFERYEEALDLEFAESLPLVVEDVEDELVEDDVEDLELDPHAVEDEDDIDDDIEAFDLR